MQLRTIYLLTLCTRNKRVPTTGFTNQKGATTSFKVQQSQYHIDDVEVMARPRVDIAVILSRGHSQGNKVNRNMLNDKFLGYTVLR